MTGRTLAAPPATRRGRDAGVRSAYAFGLEFAALPTTTAAVVSPDAGRRRMSWAIVDRPELDSDWESLPRTVLLERRHVSGRLMLVIEQTDRGYLVAAPGYGRHLIDPDGRAARSYLPAVPPWRWQRLLFAQVLPLAASLQGLHVAHSSAVELDGRAIGFVAPSGTGKTSVCAHLVGGGASFLTDDALAIDTSDGTTATAHPGAGVISVHRRELKSMTAAARARLGPVVGTPADKIQVGVTPVGRSLPLERIYFLRRGATGRRWRVVESAPPDPSLLLGSSFIWYLRHPTYALARLEAADHLARSVRVFLVDIPPSIPAAEAARRIAHHAGSG